MRSEYDADKVRHYEHNSRSSNRLQLDLLLTAVSAISLFGIHSDTAPPTNGRYYGSDTISTYAEDNL